MATPHQPKRLTSSCSTLALLALASYAEPARAAITVKNDTGWSASFDGFVNAFLVDSFGDKAPAGAAGDAYSNTTGSNEFRVRTGFLPGMFGFTGQAPDWNGITVKGRVAFYPQINNPGALSGPPGRTDLSPNIDTRELNITIDGAFGQVLFGRALNVYQGKNVVTDMSLFGVGVPGGGTTLAGGPTLGHVGFGYLYPSFGAQLRYTTPDLSGLKLAVSIADASVVGTYTDTRMPVFEGELSYARKMSGATFQAWVSGLVTKAWNAAGADVTSSGGAAGVEVGVSGFDLLASGFMAKGIGTFGMLNDDAVDAAGTARTSQGFLVQATYQAGATKLGVNYGQSINDQTDAEKAAGGANIDQRRSVTAGVYHDLTPWLRLVGEYTWAQLSWHDVAAKQVTNVLSAGAFLFW